MRFTGDNQKNFRKNSKSFSHNSFERILLRKVGFLLVPVGEEWFLRLTFPFGYFWRCENDEILLFLLMVLHMMVWNQFVESSL